MNLVHLLPVGKIEPSLLMDLCVAIGHSLNARCEILPVELDPVPAYHIERQQYHSSEILQAMQQCITDESWRVLGVTMVGCP